MDCGRCGKPILTGTREDDSFVVLDAPVSNPPFVPLAKKHVCVPVKPKNHRPRRRDLEEMAK